MLETIRKNAEQRFAMRKEEAREEKMSGESRESSVQRQIDGDGLIGEWEERYGKKKKKPERAKGPKEESVRRKKDKAEKKDRDRKCFRYCCLVCIDNSRISSNFSEKWLCNLNRFKLIFISL